MAASANLAEFALRLERQFGVNRSVLFGVGLGCFSLGVVAMALPVWLFGWLIQVVGALLLLAAGVKAFQLLLGRKSTDARRRGWPIIVFQVLLDTTMGVLLLNHLSLSGEVLAAVFGLLFTLEGVILIYIALRSPTATSRRWMAICGVVTSAAGLVILLRLVSEPLAWVGVLTGLKLVMFGTSLVWIALRALRSDSALIYEATKLVPERAELYSVYFGTGFHLGVYIGDDRVVHFLDDNQVHEGTWGQFLDGRVPRHWTYPDVEIVSADDVVATALSEVGKRYKYNVLTFNCEHFAIFCKTGGRTDRSRYAQVASGVFEVGEHPLLGTIAELNTRFIEWLAFHFGGPAGKSLSLWIRRVGAAVTSWLVSLAQEKPPRG